MHSSQGVFRVLCPQVSALGPVAPGTHSSATLLTGDVVPANAAALPIDQVPFADVRTPYTCFWPSCSVGRKKWVCAGCQQSVSAPAVGPGTGMGQSQSGLLSSASSCSPESRRRLCVRP